MPNGALLQDGIGSPNSETEKIWTGIGLRLPVPQKEWFHAVAKASGMSLSELVRLSVAREGVRLGVPFPGTDEPAP